VTHTMVPDTIRAWRRGVSVNMAQDVFSGDDPDRRNWGTLTPICELQIRQLTTAATPGCPNANGTPDYPNASDRRSCPNANGSRGCPIANGPTGPA
jgi:hypothetical protein